MKIYSSAFVITFARSENLLIRYESKILSCTTNKVGSDLHDAQDEVCSRNGKCNRDQNEHSKASLARFACMKITFFNYCAELVVF